MSSESNIILITNNDDAIRILKPKLILLREVDNLLTSNYSNAIESIKKDMPDTIIIHCAQEKQECIDLIKLIKNDIATRHISILLVADEYERDFMLNAYDENITDFVTLKSDAAEFLMRTIWCLENNVLRGSFRKQYNLLKKLEVVDKETGFYTTEFCEKVFENEIHFSEKNRVSGIMIEVSPKEEAKVKINMKNLALAIQASTRISDVIAHSIQNKFYILLTKTHFQGAQRVFKKIKENLGEDSLIASATNILQKSFATIKNELLNGLIEAENSKQDFVIVESEPEENQGDWMEKMTSAQKNFKLFKQAFNKKLEKVITPVFFQTQKLYEDKLYKTLIEQYSNASSSNFLLKKESYESELKITYPGFSKINIDIIHHGLDTPENRRITLDISELDEVKLTQILEEFIEEFKTGAEK